MLVVEAGFDWDDVGSWQAVASYFKNDGEANAANCEITAVDSTNNIVFDQDGTKIALLGVHNLIVVRTGDALARLSPASGGEDQESGREIARGIAMSGLAIVRRILGVDFGQARIGVAISDELGLLAHPLETIPGSEDRRGRATSRGDRAREKRRAGRARNAAAHEWRVGHGGRRSDGLRGKIAAAPALRSRARGMNA